MHKKRRVPAEPTLHIEPSWLPGMGTRWRLRTRNGKWAYAAWWASGVWWYGGRLPRWRYRLTPAIEPDE